MVSKITQHLPSGLFLAFVAKSLIITPSITDIGTIVCISALVGMQYFLERNAEYSELEKKAEVKLAEMVAIINTQNDVLKKMAIELDGVRNNVSGMKLQQSMKKVI